MNWVAVTSTSETISGKVNGFTTDLVVDTCAEITVVPGNLVYEGQILPDRVEIVGATGVPVSAKTARLEFEVEGITFDKVVAVASPGMMCEHVLYSVSMPKNKAMQLLVDACKSEAGTGENFVVHDKLFAVNENPEVRVVTRNQKKKAEVVEAVALVQDRAGVIVKSAQGKEKTNGKEETLVPKPIGREVFMGQQVVNSQVSVIHSDLVSCKKVEGLKQKEVRVEESERAPGVEVAASGAGEDTLCGDHVEGERDGCLDDVEGVRDECLDDESEVAECGKQSDVTDVCDVDLGCPNLSDGIDLTLLKKEISEDESLKHCRRLATNNLMGYG